MYTKEDRRNIEDSLKKRKSPKKAIKGVAGSKEKKVSIRENEWHKRNCQYTASIIGGAPKVSNISKT